MAVDGFKVSFSRDLGKFVNGLNDAGRKQLPFAAARALTQTAQAVKEAERREIESVFDRPTRFALNGLYVKPATKTRLYANVFFREFAPKGTPAVKFMAAEVYGGKRRVKRFERALQQAGVLDKGKGVVPGKGARVDKYGNMSRGQIVQILSALRASPDHTQNRAAGKKTQYFVGAPGGAPKGVWQRKGKRGVVPVMIFIDLPSYDKRLPFFQVAAETSIKVFPSLFKTSFEGALRTARP